MPDSQSRTNTANWKVIIKGLAALLFLIVIVVGLVAAFVIVFGPAIISFFSSFSALDTGVIVALIAGAVSIITLVGGGVLNNRMRRNEYLYKHREKPYMQLISIFYDFTNQAMKERKISEEELLNIVTEFNKEITLWGSSKAIKKWGKWRTSSSRDNTNPKEVLFEMEKVLIQLRKDMGLKHGINRGDLLRLTINDIDNYLTD